MKYRIAVTTSLSSTIYYLQASGEVKRTLLASNFIWNMEDKGYSVFENKQVALKWFNLLAKYNQTFKTLTLEVV